mmetsp:Transcript_25291/g.68478  ORF Transcript_25291/g.68478 Transcript_25291/m.68478 type:complete len:523 (+) Transcript_25291:71-1639(+)
MSAELQLSMRRNAEELQEFMIGMGSWEADIKKQDMRLRGGEATAALGTSSAKAAGAAEDVSDDDSDAELAEAVKEAELNRAAKDGARSSGVAIPSSTRGAAAAASSASSASSGVRHHDRYAEWDKFDAEGEAAALDEASAKEARRLVKQRKREAAASARQRALAEEKAAGLRQQGNQAFGQALYEEATLHYTEALVLNPRSAAAYANRALALLKLGKWEEAEEDCSAALVLEHTHVKALLRRAEARHKVRDLDGAAQDLRTALEFEPKNSQAKAKLDAVNDEAREARVRARSTAPVARTRVPVVVRGVDEANVDDPFVRALGSDARGAGAGVAGHAGPRVRVEAKGAGGDQGVGARDAAAAAAARAAAVSRAQGQELPVPATAAALERALCRTLAKDPAGRIRYVQRIPVGTLKRLFRPGLSPEACGAVVDVLGALCDAAAHAGGMALEARESVRAVAEALACMERRALALMFLDDKQREALRAATEMAQHPEPAAAAATDGEAPAQVEDHLSSLLRALDIS